ncbi:hypothetical protein OTU49_010107, partial [Cherax quadricarinatus]
SYAVTGNTLDTPFYHSLPGLVYPWWIVDLGDNYSVYQILIYPRRDSSVQRFHNIEIRVGTTLNSSGNLTSYTLFSTYLGPYASSYGLLVCNRMDGVMGRYVSIQRASPEDDMLQLINVRVYVH